MEQPLVSVCCATFNHVNYIRHCLDGFVMQQTSFPIEVIVNDDCSTDGTTEIVREYAEMYPGLILPIFHDDNQYSKGVDILEQYVFPRCRGKYIALCEGDDYWTDPLQLQKQVEYLEAHGNYSMCFHNATSHWVDGAYEDSPFSFIEDRDYSGPEIFEKWMVPTASVLFRKEVVFTSYYQNLSNNPSFCYGDIIVFISCANFGLIRGFKEIMSVYNRHCDSAVFNTTELKKIDHNITVYKAIGGAYKETARRFIFQQTRHLFTARIVPTKVFLKYLVVCGQINLLKTIYFFLFDPILHKEA